MSMRYLSEPVVAEKYSLLNMAMDPATTARALLRACTTARHCHSTITDTSISTAGKQIETADWFL